MSQDDPRLHGSPAPESPAELIARARHRDAHGEALQAQGLYEDAKRQFLVAAELRQRADNLNHPQEKAA